ncbi:YceI family protein [Planctomonas sp. JC2975]|uniref:YceI family protein n=1 Tax=Planctomonas sp. JC2975 TaxID=2729626 RepID=UPI001473C204|nr:YceI family protein [Planctomonas sp. JC2975]NNC10871.1 YceI family protein [Planctomonas sp. JC2975]
MTTRTTLSTEPPTEGSEQGPAVPRRPGESTAVLPAATLTPAAAGEWLLDAAESTVEFTSAVLGGSMPAHGRFEKLAGRVLVEPDGQVAAKVTVDTTSVATRIPTMTMHLRTAGLLAVKRHPSAEFELDDLVVHGSSAEIRGRLTALGVTREVALNATGGLDGPELFRLEGEALLHRSEFGLRWNVLKMVPEDVRLDVRLVFVKAGSDRRTPDA